MKRFIPLLIAVMIGPLLATAQNEKRFQVYFPFDQFSISREAAATLDSIQLFTQGQTGYTLRIKGYTDESGSEEYNNRLAQRRAEAVAAWLTNKGLAAGNFGFTGKGDELFNDDTPDEARRKVTIDVTIPMPATYTFYGKYGTEVVSTSPAPLTVTEYFSAGSMLQNSMYALDASNNILETGGMLTICRQTEEKDASGKYYLVRMPNQGLQGDFTMRIWLEVRNSRGELRWQLSEIKLVNDMARGMFVFQVPVTTASCIRINIDQLVSPENNNAAVYVSFYKPFPFHDVEVSGNNRKLSFSAKLSDSLYVFVKRANQDTRDMRFWGELQDSSRLRVINESLRNCIYTADANGTEHYHFCDTCFHDPTIPLPRMEETPPPAPAKKKRRGFFQWLADLFR